MRSRENFRRRRLQRKKSAPAPAPGEMRWRLRLRLRLRGKWSGSGCSGSGSGSNTQYIPYAIKYGWKKQDDGIGARCFCICITRLFSYFDYRMFYCLELSNRTRSIIFPLQKKRAGVAPFFDGSGSGSGQNMPAPAAPAPAPAPSPHPWCPS